jgi:hypothetical protein
MALHSIAEPSVSTIPTVPVGKAIDLYIAKQPKLIVVPNMGNAGDSLINYSIYSLLKKRSLPFSIVEPQTVERPSMESTYLLMVNGELHDGEASMDRAIRVLSGAGARIVLCSATIKNRDTMLRQLPQNATVIARELVTYRYIQSMRSDIQTVLSEDFTMGIADGDADLPNPSFLMRLQYRIRLIRNVMRSGYPMRFGLSPHGYRNGRAQPGEVFDALRTDSEKLGGGDEAPGNIDLSVVCAGRQAPGHAEASAASLLGIIGSKSIVKTDRLHVAIGCCLMDVECWFSANSYFKCEAIYNHSLARRFPKIKWMPRTQG